MIQPARADKSEESLANVRALASALGLVVRLPDRTRRGPRGQSESLASEHSISRIPSCRLLLRQFGSTTPSRTTAKTRLTELDLARVGLVGAPVDHSWLCATFTWATTTRATTSRGWAPACDAKAGAEAQTSLEGDHTAKDSNLKTPTSKRRTRTPAAPSRRVSTAPHTQARWLYAGSCKDRVRAPAQHHEATRMALGHATPAAIRYHRERDLLLCGGTVESPTLLKPIRT